MGSGQIRVEPVGAPSYEILNIAQSTGYFVVPGKKLIVQQSPTVAQMSVAPYNIGPDPCVTVSTKENPASCKKIGYDKLTGRPTEKWQMTQLVSGKSQTSTIWVDRPLHAIVRSQSGAGIFKLVNFHFGKQPAALFALPSGFNRTQMNSVTLTPEK